MALEICLTVGWIPKDFSGDEGRISCGDPDGSGTREFAIYIRGEEDPESIFSEVSKNTFHPQTFEDWWDDASKIWGQIAPDTEFLSQEKDVQITGRQLAGCWRLLQRESEDERGLGIEIVAEGADCGGEFSNYNREYNGYFYIRYTTQFDDDYDDDEETILVIKEDN